jgi:hypothetical protein
MPVSFSMIHIGQQYSRPVLARLWGYAGYQALARGVVTPRDDNKIILFITKDKPQWLEQYEDDLAGNVLFWEGPLDHFAEARMVAASEEGDEIHVFYRERHHSDFTYEGEFVVTSFRIFSDRPSVFVMTRRQ